MTSQVVTTQSFATTQGLIGRLLATDASTAPTMLRTALAVVMFPHGAQKALGWFGGYGWDGTMGFLTGQIGMPGIAAGFVILIELLGPLLLLAGLFTRGVALAFAGIMVGAIATVHAPFGFFMNWSGTQGGEGFEFHLLAIGAAAALVLTGGGRWSLDGRLTRGRRR